MANDDMEPRTEPDSGELTLENWSDFVIEDLDATPEQQAWNRFIVLKQAEINSMARILQKGGKGRNRVDTLSSANSDGSHDPLPD